MKKKELEKKEWDFYDTLDPTSKSSDIFMGIVFPALCVLLFLFVIGVIVWKIFG